MIGARHLPHCTKWCAVIHCICGRASVQGLDGRCITCSLRKARRVNRKVNR